MADDPPMGSPLDEGPTLDLRGRSRGRSGSTSEEIGPYRLLTLLGEGGMGEVWLAEQTEPIERKVALKLVKLGMDTAQFIARFESERQALAVMDHPSIARVIDAGATRDGRPYFVMEHIRGVGITDYCDVHELTLHQRLELFMAVCDGVQHAHQKGILHRDLKPSNVLVTEIDGRPAPKIIDFGLAKATTQSLTDKQGGTVLGGWIGTPAYMSPEQAEITDDIDTRTDVYSLGVMLYELLTGERPFDAKALRSASFDEIRRVIREVEPPRPSTRVSSSAPPKATAGSGRTTAQSLARSLRGDLDWIVMRALEKEKERRYGSPAELAADIERYLTNRPVSARPPSLGYRASKFVRRNRVLAAGVAGTVLMLLLGVTASSILAVQAVRARHVAEQSEAAADLRRDQAERLLEFMLGDLMQKLEPLGRLDLLNDISEEALEYFAAVEPEELSADDLFRRTEAMIQIGEIRRKEGDLEASLEARREVLELAEKLVEKDPDNVDWKTRLGAAHFWIGRIHWEKGEVDEALERFQSQLEVARQLAEAHPGDPDLQLELANSRNNVGFVQQVQGDQAAALASFRSMLQTLEEIRTLRPDDPSLELAFANQAALVGSLLWQEGEPGKAMEHHHEALRTARDLVAREPDNADWRLRLATFHNLIGQALETADEGPRAGRHFGAALEIASDLVAIEPNQTDWQREMAVSRRLVAQNLLEQGRPDRALAELRAADATLGELLARESTPLWRRDRAMVRLGLAEALRLSGEADRARREAMDAVSVLEDEVAQNPADRAAVERLARALLSLGAAEESTGQAQARWRRALELVEPIARDSGDLTLLVLWADLLERLPGSAEAAEVRSVIEELRREVSLQEISREDDSVWMDPGP